MSRGIMLSPSFDPALQPLTARRMHYDNILHRMVVIRTYPKDVIKIQNPTRAVNKEQKIG